MANEIGAQVKTATILQFPRRPAKFEASARRARESHPGAPEGRAFQLWLASFPVSDLRASRRFGEFLRKNLTVNCRRTSTCACASNFRAPQR